jgi:mRNA-degrading endonuclease toxin of MazEF toxin-antitoxin module
VKRNNGLALASLMTCASLVVACGPKSQPAAPKSDSAVKAERDAATKATRDNPVYGDQLKTMDKAKDMGKDMNKMAEDAVKKAEGQ